MRASSVTDRRPGGGLEALEAGADRPVDFRRRDPRLANRMRPLFRRIG